MKINNNMSAVITNKQLLHTESKLTESMERLSSGFKINHAKDNPAGMAISNKMQAQIDALSRASDNASDGISALYIADGALMETASILQRMRELAVQAANDTNNESDRQAIQEEIESLKEEVDRISTDTEYNSLPLLDGSQDTRVYANDVTRIGISDYVEPGDYSLEVNSEAKKAEVGAGGISSTSTAVFGTAGKMSINGYAIEISATDTVREVYEKIRSGAESGEAEMVSSTSGDLTGFTSAEYGSEAALNISFSNQELADKLGMATAYNTEKNTWDVQGVVEGEDISVTLDTGDDSKFTTTATVREEGNKVTITDINGFQFGFLIDEGVGSGTIDFEVTDIGTMTLQIGANEGQNMEVRLPEISTKSLYIDKVDVTTVKGAGKAINSLDSAIENLSAVRAKIGAYENRLDYSVASLDTFEENMTDALSRLKDVDMAEEMTTYTQQNVLEQAGISVLSQANDLPQQVLQLLS